MHQDDDILRLWLLVWEANFANCLIAPTIANPWEILREIKGAAESAAQLSMTIGRGENEAE